MTNSKVLSLQQCPNFIKIRVGPSSTMSCEYTDSHSACFNSELINYPYHRIITGYLSGVHCLTLVIFSEGICAVGSCLLVNLEFPSLKIILIGIFLCCATSENSSQNDNHQAHSTVGRDLGLDVLYFDVKRASDTRSTISHPKQIH